MASLNAGAGSPTGAAGATLGPTAAIFMSRAEFEAMKHDPMLVLEHATQGISMLEQQERALAEENKQLQEKLHADVNRQTFAPENHAALVELAADLETDHRDLSQKYVDLEYINRMLQGLVDAMRNDKSTLSDALKQRKDEQQSLVARYSELMNYSAELEEQREAKEARLKAQQSAIDDKIRQLDAVSEQVAAETQKTIELQDATEKIGSARLSLESETTALEKTTQQQERTLAYLQSEVAEFDGAVNQKASEMVQLKKQMSAAILELQLQITKAEEEMTRIRTATQNENDLTGRQNLWLAKDLKGKLQELLLTRQEMTKENAELKAERAALREKSNRLKSNVQVYEKRNQAFHDTLQRLEQEDAFAKESYGQRKTRAFQQLNDQAGKVQEVNEQLQTAREDLYLIKSRLCKQCRSSILHAAQQNADATHHTDPMVT